MAQAYSKRHYSKFISMAAVVAVIISWRTVASMASRIIILVTGIFLFTPYAIQYDLVVLTIPLVVYAVEIGRNGRVPGDLTVIIMLSLLPLISWFVVGLACIQIGSACAGVDSILEDTWQTR